MQESYYGNSRTKRLSPGEIRKMKENMRKVPEIQKKAEIYHQKEKENAESILNSARQEETSIATPEKEIVKKEKRRTKIKKYLFNLFPYKNE